MKICSTLPQSDEIRVSSVAALLGALSEHPSKRVIISLKNLPTNKIEQLYKENPNLYIEFETLPLFIKFAQSQLTTDNYTRSFWAVPAQTWETIQILLHYRASDIVIGEPLFFCANDLAALKESVDYPINLRFCPTNPCPSFEGDSFARHAFILPQHAVFYETVIGTLDFYNNENIAQLYLRDKPYGGTLETIFGVDSQLPATMIDEDFVQRRLNCGQVCSKNLNRCHYCQRYVDLAALAPFNTGETN